MIQDQAHAPDMPIVRTEQGRWRGWWRNGLALIGRGTKEAANVAAQAPHVPRVEDGRGEPNTVPWNFLITKPAVRRPAMDWIPQEGDRFGNLTLGALLQFNSQTGMYVFRVRECPEVVLNKTLKRENSIKDHKTQ